MPNAMTDEVDVVALLQKAIEQYNSQQQRLHELQAQNAQLQSLVADLRRQLHDATHSPPSLSAVPRVSAGPLFPQNAVAAGSLSTQPLPSSPAAPPPPAAAPEPPVMATSPMASPSARVTRSQTRLSELETPSQRPSDASAPSSADRLLDEIAQEERASREGSSQRKRKVSVAERVHAAKRTAVIEDERKAAAASPVNAVDVALQRAMAHKNAARDLKGTNAREAAASYQRALDVLSTLPPSSHTLPSVRELYASLYHALGVLADSQGNKEEARDSMQRCVDWRPGWHKAWLGLGQIEHNRRQFERAVEAFDKAAHCDVEDAERERIERARRISEAALRASPQQHLLDAAHFASPMGLSPAGTPTRPSSADTARPSRALGDLLNQADFSGRRVLGDLTNVSGAMSPAPSSTAASSQSRMAASDRAALLRLPCITKEGIRDLLGSERFALAGKMSLEPVVHQWKVDGTTLRARVREPVKTGKSIVEVACTFRGDRAINFRCDCMTRPDGRERQQHRDRDDDDGVKRPQELIAVRGSSERCPRYGACEHIGVALLTIIDKQKELDLSSASAARPALYVHPAHRPSGAQLSREQAARAHYEGMKVDQLRVILKANDTRSSGVKEALVERCVEGELWGVPEGCDQCVRGRLYYSGGVWRCRGSWDEAQKRFIRCDNIVAQPRTHPWRSD